MWNNNIRYLSLYNFFIHMYIITKIPIAQGFSRFLFFVCDLAQNGKIYALVADGTADSLSGKI